MADDDTASHFGAFDASMVIVDRDALRNLRVSEAANEIAAAAKGEDALKGFLGTKKGVAHIYQINPYDLMFEDDHFNPRNWNSPLFRDRVVEYAY